MLPEIPHLLVEMESISDFKEKVYIRFPYPMRAKEGPLVGIGIQYDYDGCPEASINVLSRRELSEQQFRELVKSKISIPQDRLSIRCT